MKLKIVFVPRRSRIRPYKMAKALKYTGKAELILVCEESFYDPDLFNGIFDEVHFFTKKSWLFKLPKAEKIYRRLNERFGFGFRRMTRIINEIKPDIVQCYAEPYNHIVHILKNTSFPVIMSDGADFTGISNGIENLTRLEAKYEKYAFENVNGIVHKGPSYEIEYFKNSGYKISCRYISWFDHCDEDLFPPQPLLEKNINDIHIVYTGAISSDPNKKYIYYIDFAKILATQKIHFHIYPNPIQYQFAREYKKLSLEEKYFHFHEPLNYRDLTKEISKYTWGLWWHEPTGEKRVFKEKRKVGIGNKIFTYLESGLPVIVGDHTEYGVKIVLENDLGFTINSSTIKNIGEIIQGSNYKFFSKNVREFSFLVGLKENSNRLMDFYSKIVFEFKSKSHKISS